MDIITWVIDAIVVMAAYANILVSAVLLLGCLFGDYDSKTTAFLQTLSVIPLVGRALGWW